MSGIIKAGQWNDSGAEEYLLYVGTTGPGSHNVHSSGRTTSTSQTVSGLPGAGETVHVRLHSLIDGSWHYRDCTYTATE